MFWYYPYLYNWSSCFNLHNSSAGASIIRQTGRKLISKYVHLYTSNLSFVFTFFTHVLNSNSLVFLFFLDKVYPLPQNWPKIPQVFRRKSCELTKNTSPCVNKAVSHLELIQGIIEEWFKEREEECKEQAVALRQGNSY